MPKAVAWFFCINITLTNEDCAKLGKSPLWAFKAVSLPRYSYPLAVRNFRVLLS